MLLHPTDSHLPDKLVSHRWLFGKCSHPWAVRTSQRCPEIGEICPCCSWTPLSFSSNFVLCWGVPRTGVQHGWWKIGYLQEKGKKNLLIDLLMSEPDLQLWKSNWLTLIWSHSSLCSCIHYCWCPLWNERSWDGWAAPRGSVYWLQSWVLLLSQALPAQD